MVGCRIWKRMKTLLAMTWPLNYLPWLVETDFSLPVKFMTAHPHPQYWVGPTWRCICVTRFWRLKQGFRHNVSSTAPGKCIFTILVPQFGLKVNSIMWMEFCAWKWACYSLKPVKAIKTLKLSIDRLLILWSLHESLRSLLGSRLHNSMSLDTQDIEREQLQRTQNCDFECRPSVRLTASWIF